MLKNVLFFLTLCYCCLFAADSCFGKNVRLPEKVRITTNNWRPYTSTDGSGIYIDIVNAALKEMGVTPEYVYYPWRRGEKYVAEGKVWCTFPYTINIDRSTLYLFSDPLNESSTDIFYYGPDKGYAFDRISDLKKYRMGGTAGYYFSELFAREGVEAFYTPDELSGLKMLQKGRIDLFVLNRLVGWYIINSNFGKDKQHFHTLGKPLSVNPQRLMVSRSYPGTEELLERFNEALAKIKASGKVRMIFNEHTSLH